MGKYEITQGQWQAVMGTNPASGYGVGFSYPVYSISWNDIQSFLTALNGLGIGTFRLPSEAEWEYACHAGTSTRFPFDGWETVPNNNTTACALGNYAWYGQNGAGASHPVGQKLPNAFGLYDMMGNVWEWCQDWYHVNYTGAPTDGSAWESPAGSYRVLRGGDWYGSPLDCRPADRNLSTPDARYYNYGFRLARTP